MTELDLKKQFAKLLLKNPNDPFSVAIEVFPYNNSRALRVATEWPTDPEVIQAREEFLSKTENELDLLPNKVDAARSLWDRAHSELTDNDSFTKIMKLYCDVRGYIEKPGTNVNIQNNDNKIMVVKDMGTDDEWEAKLAKQQSELTDVSSD